VHHHGSGQRANLVIGVVQNQQRHGQSRQCSGQALHHREYLGSGPSPDPAPVHLQQFAKIRQLAPPQQAVVAASVPAIAVKSLGGDRAIVLVFLDQQAHQGGEGKPLLATGRLSITAQRVDGRWKIGRRGAILIGTREGP
jgi:hypothetical protein